ncbi:hypothetical protein KSP40_PGU017510 [Platanthera guangdongensis]|uniref:Uncharacterized protein n=1 Tax=Platanthera guangdongensis TaxID=2320717 RepID=A0ABR2M818_9ASPA
MASAAIDTTQALPHPEADREIRSPPAKGKGVGGEGLRQYYLQHIHDLQLQVRQKSHNLNRLEAQRNDLNAKERKLGHSCLSPTQASTVAWNGDGLIERRGEADQETAEVEESWEAASRLTRVARPAALRFSGAGSDGSRVRQSRKASCQLNSPEEAPKEAQRGAKNSVRALREELQLLQEPGSYVGEVVKVMGKSKVLVKLLYTAMFQVVYNLKQERVHGSCTRRLGSRAWCLLHRTGARIVYTAVSSGFSLAGRRHLRFRRSPADHGAAYSGNKRRRSRRSALGFLRLIVFSLVNNDSDSITFSPFNFAEAS